MSNEEKILKGTTTVGITCEDGVVFASERRATMGNLVAHKVAEKIFKIDNHIAAITLQLPLLDLLEMLKQL